MSTDLDLSWSKYAILELKLQAFGFYTLHGVMAAGRVVTGGVAQAGTTGAPHLFLQKVCVTTCI